MQVGLIGSGNMARALARGWGDPVLCTDGGSGRAAALADELGGEAVASRGIPVNQASTLVTQWLAGSARLLDHMGHGTLRLRREVASPGGTTAAGLAALEHGRLRAAFHSAIDTVLEPA